MKLGQNIVDDLAANGLTDIASFWASWAMDFEALQDELITVNPSASAGLLAQVQAVVDVHVPADRDPDILADEAMTNDWDIRKKDKVQLEVIHDQENRIRALEKLASLPNSNPVTKSQVIAKLKAIWADLP